MRKWVCAMRFFKAQKKSEQLEKQIEEQRARMEELTRERDRLLEQYNANTFVLEQFREIVADRLRQEDETNG